MRTLKVLVVVMGILIIGGVILLGVTLANRMEKKDNPEESGDIIHLPPHSHIKELQLHEGQIILRLDFPEKSHEEIWLISGKKGDIIKKITTQ